MMVLQMFYKNLKKSSCIMFEPIFFYVPPHQHFIHQVEF